MTTAILHASLALAFSLAASPRQGSELSVEVEERTRQAISFRSNTTPGNLDPATGTLTFEFAKGRPSEEEALAVLDLAEGAVHVPGSGFPPTFETDLPLVFGKTKLAPGLHLVRLERAEAGWSVVFVELADALAAGWNGGAELPGKGVAVAADVRERREGGATSQRLWTGPGENGRGLVLHVDHGRLHLAHEVEAKAKKGQPAGSESERRRVNLRGADGACIASVEHGSLEWNQDSAEELAELKKGARWALAKDHWTSLIVLAPLELGGVALAPGDYALVLERAKDGWELVLLDGATRRKAFTNAHHAEDVKAKASVPLEHAEGAGSAPLTAGFSQDGQALRLELAYGPHRWTAPLVAPD